MASALRFLTALGMTALVLLAIGGLLSLLANWNEARERRRQARLAAFSAMGSVCESQYQAMCSALVSLNAIDGRRLDVLDKELLADAQDKLAGQMSGSIRALRMARKAKEAAR